MPDGTDEPQWVLSPFRASDVAAVMGHRPTAGVRRTAPGGFPLHVAVHEVSLGASPAARGSYCDSHIHADEDELNIFIPAPSMEYAIDISGEHLSVSAASALLVRAGVPHSANALNGSGWFICIRFPQAGATTGLHDAELESPKA